VAVKRKLDETAIGVAPVAAAAPVAMARAAAAAPEAKRARIEAVPPASQHQQQPPMAAGVVPSAQPAQSAQQRQPTRAEVVAPFLEDFRFFLQHVREFQPSRHTPEQVDGVSHSLPRQEGKGASGWISD
jgi:hypothetical protein